MSPRRRARMRLWLVGIAALGLLLGRGACEPDVRIATFNIRRFPGRETDRSRVAATLAEVDADVVAVQEIRDIEGLRRVAEDASRATGRDYRAITSQCGGNKVRITTGLVWDAARWQLVERRDYPGLREGGTCGLWQAGVLGVFENDDGERFGALSVHLRPLPDRYEERKEQWQQVMALLEALRAELDIEIVALGDYNSTGFRGHPAEERRFVEELLDAAGYELPTREIECTEYWRPKDTAQYVPSILDHIVVTGGSWKEATPEGLCRRLGCTARDPDDRDPDWHAVSDHCPVVVEGDL